MMIGKAIFPFALGFVLGGLIVSVIDGNRRPPPPGPWYGYIHDVDGTFIDDSESSTFIDDPELQ
ncbi:MAG: hypothetical protein QGF72_00165 [Candidatus Poseidoniaceae archaeon]|nr:hypothetical protein [Candidatus Poseidoniaceae archaeon]